MRTRTTTRVLLALLGAIASPLPAAAEITFPDTASIALRTFSERGAQVDRDVVVPEDPTNASITATSQLEPALGSLQTSTTSLEIRTAVGDDAAQIEVSGSFRIVHDFPDGPVQLANSGAVALGFFRVCISEPMSFSVSASGEIEGTLETFAQGGNQQTYNPVFMSAGVDAHRFVAGIGDIDAGGAPVRPNASLNANGVLIADCHSVGGTIDARLAVPQEGFVQGPFLNIPEVRGSFRIRFSLSPAGPDESESESDIFTWVGPAQGAFGDEGNWRDENGAAGVPGFVSLAEADTARFQGGTVRVDLAALAAASRAPRGVAAQCAGPVTRTIGRLVLDAAALEPVNGALALDSLALDARSLTVEDNGLLDLREATLCARHAEIGATGRPSAALVSGPGGVLQTLGSLSVGSLGEGTLRVLSGGIVSSEEVLLGDGLEKGAAIVSDATWQTGNLAVGFQSTGELTIENAGLVESENAFVDRDLDPAGPETARATVRGANSTWRVNSVVIGGKGIVEVKDGARLDAPSTVGFVDGVVVGQANDPGEATLLVNQGGELRTQALLVGHQGTGRLIVGEAFDRNPLVDADFGLFVGGEDGGRGRVQVVGDPSTDGFSLVSDHFQIGDDPGSNGELLIDFGGKALTSAGAFVGTNGGRGRVLVIGSPLDPPELTRWQISGSLTVGGPEPLTGNLLIRDAVVDVGTLSTPGEVFVLPGGAIVGTGSQSNLLRVAGGLITNHGLIAGPLTVDGRYDPASTGVVESAVAGLPPSPRLIAVRSPAGVIAALGARRPKPALPPLGPIVFTGDTDLAGTLALQFLNGFAPDQGQSFEVLDVAGTVTGAFANVEVRGLVPGSDFAEDFVDGKLTLTALADTEALPTVSVKTKPSVNESKFKKGLKVKFKRKGDTSEPLQVAYTLGGTARNGFDYERLAGVIEIPARKKSATLVIRPIPDGVTEGPETIELEVQPGENYTQSLFARAEIVLENKVPKNKKN